MFAWFAARTHDMLNTPYIWPVFIAGAASAIPPVEGVMVLTVIMASRADLGTQLSAFVVFTLLLLSIIEIPLVSYLVRPEKTLAVVERVQSWIHAHLRQIMQALLTICGRQRGRPGNRQPLSRPEMALRAKLRAWSR